MPLPKETECIVQEKEINLGLATDPEKFLVYAWEGRSRDGGGNWKITVPLTVISQTQDLFPLLENRKNCPPRITLGKPGPPEPPIIMGGGVPILGLTASTRIDPETKRRSDEYKLLRSQALPAQERHEYQAYPQDIQLGKPRRRNKNRNSGAENPESLESPKNQSRGQAQGQMQARIQEQIRDQVVYHSYLGLAWQYLGLQDRVLDCIGNLESACYGHYLPPELLEQSISGLRPSAANRTKNQNIRFSSALRHRMEAYISQGKVALLMGNLRAVAMQIETITGEVMRESELRELESFQAFEELAALDRQLPVLYLYPFYNIYEMERAEERRRKIQEDKAEEAPEGHNLHSKEISYKYPLREMRCLLQPGPLQQKLELYADPSAYF